MKIFSVNEMSSLRIVLSMKCPSVKCPVYKMSILGNVSSMKCLSIVLKWVGGGVPLWNFVTFVLFHWTSKLKFLGFVRKIYELRMTNIFFFFFMNFHSLSIYLFACNNVKILKLQIFASRNLKSQKDANRNKTKHEIFMQFSLYPIFWTNPFINKISLTLRLSQ